MPSNGDTSREFNVGGRPVRGLGSFHKTLPHNEFGEVDPAAFRVLVAASEGDGSGFMSVPEGRGFATQLTNPQAGLAADRLTRHPSNYSMPPAPGVLSVTTAAEMVELYWMAHLRDLSFEQFSSEDVFDDAAAEIQTRFHEAIDDAGDAGRLITGVDVPGASGTKPMLSRQNVFRMGLPGEEVGPLVSQFFLRDVQFGTQRIDQRQRPYKRGRDFLTTFDDWLLAQNTGLDRDLQSYSRSNESGPQFFEPEGSERYISTMRDLARFVNKDALHQAYFNAALLMLTGGARWTPGNPYGDTGRLRFREAGFGVLGGPHILALVSEVATRALKIVWYQKWQVHLRLRPEAYGGLVHVQQLGVGGTTRPYGLPDFVAASEAAGCVRDKTGTLLLPMAFTAGSPTHPAYGAGHATVAGACVTVLKAYFKTFDTVDGVDVPVRFDTLRERTDPYGPGETIKAYVPGLEGPEDDPTGKLHDLNADEAAELTIEGELNKLASNVAMGRSMGGVHWRTDNTRSLNLGEAMAAQILADITVDVNECPSFEFRTFSRRADGQPKKVVIRGGKIHVDGRRVEPHPSVL